MNQEDTRVCMSKEPYGLLDVLRDHCVEEFGSLFFYKPLRRGCSDQGATVWLELLNANGVTPGKPWRVKPQNIAVDVRETISSLFEGNPTTFEVYRIDRIALAKLLSRLDGRFVWS